MAKRITRVFVLLFFATMALVVRGQDQSVFGREDFEVEIPRLIVSGISHKGQVIAKSPEKLFLFDHRLSVVVNGSRQTLEFENGVAEFDVVFDRNEPFSLKVGGFTHVRDIRPMPLWLSILPPLLVIFLALAFKEVVSSLIIGIFSGAMIVAHYSTLSEGIWTGLLSAIDVYLVSAMADESHVSVIVFSTLIGGIVAVISKNGGMQAVVDRIARRAGSPKSGQLATWFLGIGIFFDDYANTLVVGNTMRPLTDRLRISREKLSYIVDSTAAPIAAVALITTWIGAELGYIQTALDQINRDEVLIESSPYSIFLGSLQYSFYPFLALVFMLILILRNRDFGPMHRAEVTTRDKGVSGAEDVDISSEMEEFAHEEGIRLRMSNAIVPILIVIFGTMAGLWYTGGTATAGEDQASLSFTRKLSVIVGNSDSYKALLWSSTFGLIAAVLLSVLRRSLSFTDSISAAIAGFKAMVPAVLILILAWSLAALTEEMRTADYLAGLAEGNLATHAVPAITFILSALVAFSTGSSWGTMAIIYPIMLPLSFTLAIEQGMAANEAMEILLNSTSCVLAGAVLGDHCSPISDTTILSSLATRCDHIQHVRTQLPYALTVGLVALAFTLLSATLRSPWYLNYVLGIAALYLIVSLVGKKVVVEGL
jgi:Na+/H+ antiporter NhaC